jgi:hypothetical protein
MAVATPLPWDFQVSADYQNSPGVNTTATYPRAANGEVRASRRLLIE